MKTHRKTKNLLRVVLVASALVGAAPFIAGCTSTATSKSTGEMVDDAVVTAKVKAALARDSGVNAFAVNVETYKGVVQLSGFVDSEAERQRAQAEAAGVNGVLSVVNNLTVKGQGQNPPRDNP